LWFSRKFLRSRRERAHIIADTVSKTWHQPELEKRAARGARILRAIHETTPEQTIHFDSVIVSSTGDVCYFAKTNASDL